MVALGAGVLASAGFDPPALGWLVPAATAVWLAATAGAGDRGALVSGYLFGLGFFLPLLAWLGPSISIGAWIGLSCVQALWFALAAAGVRYTRGVRGRPLAVASVLTAVELARQFWPFGGLPWGRAGFAAVDTAWSGLLPWLGVTGTTFVFMLLAATAAEALRLRSLRSSAVLAVVATCSVVPAVAPSPVAAGGALTVAAVQGGVPGDGTSVATYARTITRDQRDATKRLARRVAQGDLPEPELVVWPESSTSVDPVRDALARRAVTKAVQEIQVPLLVNGIVGTSDPGEALNQALLWSPSGGPGARYTKRHPVPFGEYIPFRDVLGDLSDRFREIPRDLLPGRPSPPLVLPGEDRVLIAVAICFDVAYDDVIPAQVAAGGELVVVQTSNATFSGTSQLDQQLTITRARALEAGRAVVVASINGLTAAVYPDGSVVAQAPSRTTEVLVERVPLVSELTPAIRVRRLVPVGVWLLAVSSMLLGWADRRQLRRLRSRRSETTRRSTGSGAPTAGEPSSRAR